MFFGAQTDEAIEFLPICTSRRRSHRAFGLLRESGFLTYIIFEGNVLSMKTFGNSTFKEIFKYYATLINQSFANLVFYFISLANPTPIVNGTRRDSYSNYKGEACVIQCVGYDCAAFLKNLNNVSDQACHYGCSEGPPVISQCLVFICVFYGFCFRICVYVFVFFWVLFSDLNSVVKVTVNSTLRPGMLLRRFNEQR